MHIRIYIYTHSLSHVYAYIYIHHTHSYTQALVQNLRHVILGLSVRRASWSDLLSVERPLAIDGRHPANLRDKRADRVVKSSSDSDKAQWMVKVSELLCAACF